MNRVTLQNFQHSVFPPPKEGRDSHNIIRSQAGASLISVLVSLAILMAIFLSGLQITDQSTVGQWQVPSQARVAMAKYSILQSILYDPNWETQLNTELPCVMDPTKNCNAIYDEMRAKPDDLFDTYNPVTINFGKGRNHTFELKTCDACGINLRYQTDEEEDYSCKTSDGVKCGVRIRMVFYPFDCTGTHPRATTDPPCHPNQIRAIAQLDVNPTLTTDSELKKRFGYFKPERYSFEIVRPAKPTGEYFLVADRAGDPQEFSGTDVTRRLNDTLYDIGDNIELNANTVTLKPGTYKCNASAPACAVGSHSIRLVKVSTSTPTSTTVLLYGSTGNAYRGQQGNYNCSRSTISGKIVLHESSMLRIQHLRQPSPPPTKPLKTASELGTHPISVTPPATPPPIPAELPTFTTGGMRTDSASTNNYYTILSCSKETS